MALLTVGLQTAQYLSTVMETVMKMEADRMTWVEEPAVQHGKNTVAVFKDYKGVIKIF